MKRLLSLVMLLTMTAVVYSQTTKKELEVMAEVFGMGKKAMVANFVDLPKNDVFWTLYDEYEEKRSTLAEQRYNVLLEYAGNYVNYSDDRLILVMDKSVKVRKQMEKLLEKYYKQIKKQCGIKPASQFYMTQRFFDSKVRSHILGNLPLIEN